MSRHTPGPTQDVGGRSSADADAQLIAAAPDLLKAASSALAWIDDQKFEGADKRLDKVWIGLINAVRQATGGIEPDTHCDPCGKPMWESKGDNCSSFEAYGIETVACQECRR